MGTRAASFFASVWLATFLFGATASAVLNVSVEARPDPVRPGETVNVVVHIANESAAAAGAATLSMTLPSSIVAFNENLVTGVSNCNLGVDATLCEPGEAITTAFGTLGAGEGATVSFPAVVASGGAAPPDGTVLTFAVTGSATAQAPVNASGTVVVESAPALDLALEPDHDPVVPGETLTYQLHYANKNASGSLANVLLSVPVPPGTSFVSASDGGGLNGGNVEWALGSLAAGVSGARSFSVAVGAGLGAGSRLDANATLTGGLPLRSARAVARTRVQLVPELDIRILPGLDPIDSGQRQTTTVVVSNHSATNSGGVTITLRLPDWIETFAENALVGLSNCDRGADANACEPGEQILWSLGTLAVGEARHLVLPPLIRSDGLAPVDGELVSLHAIASDSANRYATVQRSFAIGPPPDLTLALEPDRPLALPGDTVYYRIRYGNQSPTSSPSTVLEAVLPPGVSFVSATGGGTASGDRVSWSLGTLAPGESGERTLAVAVSSGAGNGQAIELRGRISNAVSPLDEARGSSHVRVLSTNELDVALEFSADPIAPGEQFTASVTVSNPSAIASGGVTINLVLPDGIEPFSESALVGLSNCDRGASAVLCEPGETILWAFGTIGAGQSRIGTFTTRVSSGGASPPSGALLRFEAIALDSGNRGARANASLPVDDDGKLTLAVSDDRDPVAPGDRIHYRLDFGNRAVAGTAPGVALELTLPVGTSFVEASDGGLLVGDTVTWTPGDLAAGASRSVSLTVDAGVGLASGTLLAARARLFDTSAPAARTSTVALTRVNATRELQTTLELNPDPAAPGERFMLLATVSNPSSTTSGGVTINLVLPDWIEPFSEGLVIGLSNCDRGLDATMCEPGESVLWSFGTVGIGESRSGELSARVASGASAPAPGELLRFEAIGLDSGNRTSVMNRSLPIEANDRLTLAIDDEFEPTAPGSDLTYRLTFANTALGATSPATTLSMPIPVGTTFVSASGGGTLNADRVDWNIGLLRDLPGEVTLTVHVDPTVPSGTLLRASAQIANGAVPIARARAEASTRVESATGLRLEIAAAPTVVGPNQVIALTFTTTNVSALNSGGVVLSVRLPEYVVPFLEAAFPGCNCDRGASATTCEPGEDIFWSLGTVGAAQTVVRSGSLQLVPPDPLLPKGEVIRFEAVATDSGNRESVATRSLPEPGLAVGIATGLLVLFWGRSRRERSKAA
jgi:uncharacterized repeat protein (TIGR01451 family)